MFLIVPVGLIESLRLLVILGVTVEQGLAVEVLLAINERVSVLVAKRLTEEAPDAVCDFVKGAERVSVEDALDVFDCVIDLVPLDEPVEVLEEVTELVPVFVPIIVFVATCDLENDGDADEVLELLPVRVPQGLPVEVLDCPVVLDMVGLALEVRDWVVEPLTVLDAVVVLVDVMLPVFVFEIIDDMVA